MFFRLSGLLAVAALATMFMWGNSLTLPHAASSMQEARSTLLMLDTACLLIVLAMLAMVASELWRELVRRSDHALALLPKDFERAAGDEMGRLTQAIRRLSNARAGLAAAEALRRRRLNVELTRRNARGLNCLQQVAALLVEAPPSEFSLVKVLGALAAGIGADSAGLRLAPATRDLLHCPTLLASQEIPLALTADPQEVAAGGASVQTLVAASGERVRCLSVPLQHGSEIIAVLAVQASETFEFDETPLRLTQTTAMLLALALTGWSRGQAERRGALLEERAAIARELHDSLAQSLAFLKIQVARLQATLRGAPGQAAAAETATQLRDGVSSAYRQVKELIAAFRVRIGSHGLNRALEEAVDEFGQRSGLVIALDNRLGDVGLSVNEEFHVLQVVREALSNTVRHARAMHAEVSLSARADGAIVAAVHDDGKGFTEPTTEPQHYGLSIMRERAASLGGELIITAQSDVGTRVCLTFVPASTAPSRPASY